MKTILLKRLRRCFYIIYYPSTKQYILTSRSIFVIGEFRDMGFSDLDVAKEYLFVTRLDYARKHFRKYSKRIIIN